MSISNPANPLKGNSGGGIVNWEDINGRPDLSTVSYMKTAPILLYYSLWDESNRQTIPVDGVLADEDQQLIIVSPKKTSRALFNSCGVELVDQLEGSLVFACKTVPEEDISVNVFIFGAVEVGKEYIGEFSWWSPQVTSDDDPPYHVSASSSASSAYAAYKAFDGNIETGWSSSGNIGEIKWIQFYSEKAMIIKGVQIDPCRWQSSASIYSGIIQGSNDGITFSNILSFDRSANDVGNDPQEYLFGRTYSYKYYRLYNLKSSYGAVATNEIKFLKMEEQA